MWVRFVVGLTIVAGVLAGCSSAPERPLLNEAQVADVMNGARANLSFLVAAESQLVARCMKAAGFVFYPAPEVPDSPTDPFDHAALSVADAKRDGYGLVRGKDVAQPGDQRADPGAAAQQANEAYVKKLTAADAERYTRTLFGTDDTAVQVKVGDQTISQNSNGCQATVQRGIYGDFAKHLQTSVVTGNVLAQASQRVSGDQELIASQKQWSQCMRQAGYVYASRRQARTEISQRYYQRGVDRNAVFRAEIATAIADATCAASTGFEQVQRAAQARAVAQVVTDYEGVLLAARELNSAAVTRAKAALATP